MINYLLDTARENSPAPSRYQPKTYWKMDATESIFKNTLATKFNRNKTDILKEKYNLKEK